MRNRRFFLFWILLVALAVFPLACSKTYRVAPQAPAPIHVQTHTSTPDPTTSSTWTPVSTDTLTEVPTDTPTRTPTTSSTWTPVSTDTPTEVPSDTSTRTPTETTTETSTDVPAETPTETPTETVEPPPIYCTTTPVTPSYYNEVEPVGVGGAVNGTNENCSPGEDIGAIAAGTSRVVTGSLSHSGNTGSTWDGENDDMDVFAFTAETTGTWAFSLDCFTNGTDTNDFDLLLFGSNCPTFPIFFEAPALYGSAYYGPTEIFSFDLTAGQTYYAMVIGWEGQPMATYRLVIASP